MNSSHDRGDFMDSPEGRHGALCDFHRIPKLRLGSSALTVLLFTVVLSYGHEFGLLGEHPLEWRTDQISRVVATCYGSASGHLIMIGDKTCLKGSGFLFDVDDRYAFDLDETVEVDVDFYLGDKGSTVQLRYERNGEAEAIRTLEIPPSQTGSRILRRTFVLDRARFANRTLLNTDLYIGVVAPWESAEPDMQITICGVVLRRSLQTPVPQSSGKLVLKVIDEREKAVPARVGIYDSTDRLPYPSKDAVTVKRLDEFMTVVNVPKAFFPWPARNPSAFYINGKYQTTLPIGRYELVVAKGPEYHIARRFFEITENQTLELAVELVRWDDLPAKGWYSGDNHIHYIRHSPNDDPNLLVFTQAEDIHVANILQAGNIAGIPWPQYGWSQIIAASDESYALVPGQEDPRTARLGHTISLNLRESIRDPQNYLLYRPIFEKARAQGGVTGYAHLNMPHWWGPHGPKGLALDVPFGLVDVVEILQMRHLNTEVWFDYLNLGYKLAPSAGTDYAFDFTLPGAERSYVHVPSPFTLQRWFEGLKSGATFVTNGPMLEFTVNGKGMGSELHLKSGDRITIEATATINPDIDFLDSLTLVEQGDAIKTVKAQVGSETKLTLRYETTAKHGSWFVLRADGKRQGEKDLWGNTLSGSTKAAVSGAIYVNVDGKRHWKPSAVPAIVAQLKQNFELLMIPETGAETEPWDTRQPTIALWDAQKPLLKQRIDEVTPIYDRLIAEAKAAMENR